MTTSNQDNQQQTEQARGDYPLTLNITYYARQNRLTTFFRLLMIIPIAVVYWGLTTTPTDWLATVVYENEVYLWLAFLLTIFVLISIVPGLALATALMIIFRRKYPRWWFDFHLELFRFFTRVKTYLMLISSVYPSTDENQNVQLEIAYPDATKLQPLLPIVKWLMIIPHLIVLFLVIIGATLVTIAAWFVILFTGKYPPSFFKFVTGYLRYEARIYAYAGLFATDEYPPFSLD